MWIISYWILPVIAGATWLGMLLGMFIHWFVASKPKYPSMEPYQNIAYISDVGAYGLKPLFITGSVVTTVFLDLSFLAERWLRHTGRLARNTSTTQKVLSIISIIFAVAGSAGLILLSIFDTYRYNRRHNGFLLLFIAGFILSAIPICAEYQRLGIHYRNHRILRISFWIKLSFILVEVAAAIAFASTTFTGRKNVGAILEWIVAFIFTGYIVSFMVDLLPSVKTKHRLPQGHKDRRSEIGELGRGHGVDGGGISMHGAGEGEYEQDLTRDSRGPNGNATSADGYENGVNADTNGQTRRPNLLDRWKDIGSKPGNGGR